MAFSRVLTGLVSLGFALYSGKAAAPPPAGSLHYASVSEWAAETNHTLQIAVTEAADPELLNQYEDPAWIGTVFAIQDQVWELMAKMDGQGSFDNLLHRIETNDTYRAGFKMILEYNVVPGEALTHADLEALAAQQLPLLTLLEGQTVGTALEGSMVTLIPAGQEIGNVTVLPTPDVFAGNATVIYLPLILLPELMPA
ncbi:hypothetical protein ABPG77_007911 [Micractinium sp. CCAP 211/92]